MNIIEINKNISGFAISSSIYKNCVMAIRFFIPLAPIDNTKTALLAQLIKDRNKKYSSKAAMQGFKDNLYGASIASRTFGYGPTQVLEVRISAISERFVDEPLQSKQLSGLADLIYQPLITKETLLEAKKNVASKINRSLENPMNAAITRSFEILGTHSTLGLSTQGAIEDLEAITVEDMVEFHQYLLYNTQAQLVIGGNFKTTLLNSVRIVFQYHQPLKSKRPFNLFISEPLTPVIETKAINQANLIEVYQTEVSIMDKNYFALRLGNVILGSLPTSLLFQEVREKNSLAYSVSSRIIAFEGLMLLTTSLDEKNIDLASSLMRQQVVHIQKGEFSETQFETAKKMMINSLDSIFDDEFSLINFIFDCAYRNLSFDVKDHKANYEIVTKAQVIQSFEKVKPVLQYQLKGDHI